MPEPAIDRDRTFELVGSLAWPAKPFPYQIEGVHRLVNASELLLADEMGLGKTIQVAAALRVLRVVGDLRPSLIVAPAGLVLQWRRHLRIWAPELKLSTVVGTGGERLTAWRADADVFLVSYESLRSDIMGRGTQAPGQRDWHVVVIDEAQKIKNATADLSSSVKRLRRRTSWALTGTPLENRLDDLISILDFVAPGRFEPRQMAIGLRRLIGEIQLRRRRRDVLKDLPPKLSSSLPIVLGGRQRAAYRRAQHQGLVRLRELGRDVRISHVLELILRLKQICNFCPESGESPKLVDVRERLLSIAEADEKALIFSQFVQKPFGAMQIAHALESFSPLLYTGGMGASVRASLLAEFERDPQRRLLILSLRAGGVGLNLSVASHAFHFDRWWNPAVEAQAEDRAHRIGQIRPVHVYAYTCMDTIEERIEEIIQEKRALFADVVDGVDTHALKRLDLDTLLELVRSA